jgi:hypothetical protein
VFALLNLATLGILQGSRIGNMITHNNFYELWGSCIVCGAWFQLTIVAEIACSKRGDGSLSEEMKISSGTYNPNLARAREAAWGKNFDNCITGSFFMMLLPLVYHLFYTRVPCKWM